MSFYHRPRRLLPSAPPPIDGGRSRGEYNRAANFDTNMVIILAALLCALIAALGINSIVRCVLRCAARVSSGDGGGGDGGAPPRLGRKGLRKGMLRRIPVAVYAAGAAVVSTECAICLGEFLEGEKIRVLPRCGHCYHVKCVDVWLGSHSSCPTCRRSLEAAAEEEEGGETAVEGGGRRVGGGDEEVG